MNFKIRNIEKEFSIHENKVNLILIEDTKFYRKTLMDLINFEKDKDAILFYEKSTLIESKKVLDIVPYPFTLDFNKSMLLKKLYKCLDRDVSLLYLEELERLKTQISDFIFRVTDEVDFDFDATNHFDLTKVFESVNLTLSYDEENFVDILVKYMSLINKIENKDVFMLLGIRSLLSNDELHKLYDYASHNKYSIIMVERVLLFEHFTEEDLFVLDSDFCEIF